MNEHNNRDNAAALQPDHTIAAEHAVDASPDAVPTISRSVPDWIEHVENINSKTACVTIIMDDGSRELFYVPRYLGKTVVRIAKPFDGHQ